VHEQADGVRARPRHVALHRAREPRDGMRKLAERDAHAAGADCECCGGCGTHAVREEASDDARLGQYLRVIAHGCGVYIEGVAGRALYTVRCATRRPWDMKKACAADPRPAENRGFRRSERSQPRSSAEGGPRGPPGR
jgi:hypothetical protein